jgi:uncharacterized protein (DUF427 family)
MKGVEISIYLIIRSCVVRKESEAMTAKPTRVPGPDHPISVERNASRVVVSIAGRTIADSREALTLREAKYPAVQYIPRKDVDMSLLERTDHATYCPYKGDCAYYSIALGGERSVNAVWTYEAPYPAVAQIKDHLAFYPDRGATIEERAA